MCDILNECWGENSKSAKIRYFCDSEDGRAGGLAIRSGVNVETSHFDAWTRCVPRDKTYGKLAQQSAATLGLHLSIRQ